MKIDSYSFGKITIDGKNYDGDVILYRNTVYPNWWRIIGHLFQINDIKKYLKMRPKKLVIGTGASQMMNIDPQAKAFLRKEHIEMVVESTSTAWKTFNAISEKEDVMAAFHLTC